MTIYDYHTKTFPQRGTQEEIDAIHSILESNLKLNEPHTISAHADGEFGEIFTPEQKEYLKANKEDLTSQVEQEIMYNHWQRIAMIEAINMLLEAGLADDRLL